MADRIPLNFHVVRDVKSGTHTHHPQTGACITCVPPADLTFDDLTGKWMNLDGSEHMHDGRPQLGNGQLAR